MQVKEVMTSHPVCCTPGEGLEEVARLLVEHDCGAIPVVDDRNSLKPVGILTDRDMVSRGIAKGKNALELVARDCMTTPVVTISEDSSLEECCQRMEANQIRRIVVVDQRGRCSGIVAQADVARSASRKKTAEVVAAVSEPNATPAA